MALFDDFRPTIVQGLMARGFTRPGTRNARSTYKDTQHMRDEMEDDAERQQRQSEATDMADQEAAVRREAAARDRRAAQIEGEPEQQYRTRLENQSWQPEKYGEAYRNQFRNQTPTQGPVREEDDEMEKRRRRRLAMAAGEY